MSDETWIMVRKWGRRALAAARYLVLLALFGVVVLLLADQLLWKDEGEEVAPDATTLGLVALGIVILAVLLAPYRARTLMRRISTFKFGGLEVA